TICRPCRKSRFRVRRLPQAALRLYADAISELVWSCSASPWCAGNRVAAQPIEQLLRTSNGIDSALSTFRSDERRKALHDEKCGRHGLQEGGHLRRDDDDHARVSRDGRRA